MEALIASSEGAAAENAVRGAAIEPGERIDPNSAAEADLDRLPGIGPALARRIVAARADGPFRVPADLERVAGIGPKKLAALADMLDFSGAVPTRSSRRSAISASVARSLDLALMSADQLQALDGVGPALAERIVEFRAGRGSTLDVDDLLGVSGIGPATLERIKRSLDRMTESR